MAISVSFNSEIFEQVIYSREDEFEQLVSKNAQTIFGDKAIYIDAKKKVNTSSLGGTIPDGFLIDLSDPDDPQFYLVEVELQNHDFFNHIFPQITKFFAFYRDSKQRHKLIETMFAFFHNDSVLTKKLRDLIGSKEVYKFLKDTIDSNQNILIIIDDPKPEFEEIINTYTDTWGKMVKVQIVNHFKQDKNNILTVEPPFEGLQIGDAISPSPEKELGKDSNYTEEFHLDGCQPSIKEIYEKLKGEFLKVKNNLRFNPTKGYIGVADKTQFAFIKTRKKKVWLIVLLDENEARQILQSKYHKLKNHTEKVQRFWGGNYPNCAVEIIDTSHWDEIQTLIARLVEKHQEIKL
jgi:predicted transport protein